MKKDVVAVALFVAALTGVAVGANLLNNGGFETTPSNWYMDCPGGTEWGATLPAPKEGNYCLKLVDPNEVADDLDTSLLRPNTTYVLTAWVYPTSDFSGTIQYGLDDGSWAGMTRYAGIDVMRKNEWNLIRNTLTIGSTVPARLYAHLYFHASPATGFIAVDAVSVVPMSDLAMNGDAETSPYADWYIDCPGGSEWVTGTPAPKEGTHCLKLVDPNEVAVTVNTSQMSPNTTYVLTAWVYPTSDFSGTIQYGIDDGSWNGMTSYAGIDVMRKNEWNLIQYTLTTGTTVPASLSAAFWFHASPATGFVAVDAISVVPLSNLALNGGFEANPLDWYGDFPGGTEWATSNPGPEEGTHCFKLFDPNELACNINSAFLRPNTTYMLTAWVYPTPDFAGTIQYGIDDGSWAGMTRYAGIDVMRKNEWNLIQNSLTTGSTVPANLYPHFYFWSSPATGFVAVDDVRMVADGTVPLTVTPEAQSLGMAAGQFSAAVLPGTVFSVWNASVVEGADWLTITAGNTGTGAGTVTVSYTDHSAPSEGPRTGRIRVTGTMGSADVVVTQAYTPIVFDLPVASEPVSVDGILNEWNGVTWISMNRAYDGTPSDISQAFYAAKWSPITKKIYVAVMVEDTAHYFTSDYAGWASRDAVEVYLHTAAGGNITYGARQEAAQQWVVGMKLGTIDQVWESLRDSNAIPASSGFSAAGMVDEAWIYYEMELTPYDYFGGLTGQPNQITTLHGNQLVGLDVVAVGNNGSGLPGTGGVNGYTGMKCENLRTGKSNDWTQFRQYKLEAVPPLPGDANGDGFVNFADFATLQNHYGQTVTGDTWSQGDFNADNQVTFEDFSILQNHYGEGQTGLSNPSPVAALATNGCGVLGLGMTALLAMAVGALGWRNNE